MYHKHQTQGIILKSYDSGDSNKKIALLTEDLGLIYAHVQSGRSLQSKLRGSIQEFSLGRFTLVKGTGGWKAVGAYTDRNVFKEFRRDEKRLKVVSSIFSLVRGLVGEGAHAENIYVPLKSFLEGFGAVPAEDIKSAEYGTLIKILYELGYVSPKEELSGVLSDFSLSSDNLRVVKNNKEKIVAAINQALAAAHLKM
jgi:DNA repair protein RecO